MIGSPRRLEIWLPIVIVALDQLTKALVREALLLHTSVTVIPGLIGRCRPGAWCTPRGGSRGCSEWQMRWVGRRGCQRGVVSLSE